jgi:putative transposase
MMARHPTVSSPEKREKTAPRNDRRDRPRRQRRKTDALRIAGLAIAQEGLVKRVSNDSYLVQSRGADTTFEVRWTRGKWRCQCSADFTRHAFCEHIHAVSITKNPSNPDGADGKRLCPRCDSTSPFHVRNGDRSNMYGIAQVYKCTICGLRFVDRPGFKKMRSNPRAIMASLDLYFKGVSLSNISTHLLDFYYVKVTPTSVYNWIRKYMTLIEKYTRHLHPAVSDRWHADETKVKVKKGERHAYLWNMMDSKTRFIIAKHLSFHRGSKEAGELLSEALARTQREPHLLITDGLRSYESALDEKREQGLLKSTHHRSGISLRDGSNNAIERMHGTLKERTKTLRGLGNIKSGRAFTYGLTAYYNYIRPHSALNGSTPAESAGIGVKGPNRWRSLIETASRGKRRRWHRQGSNRDDDRSPIARRF